MDFADAGKAFQGVLNFQRTGDAEARFPVVKSLDSFDFAAIPSLNKTLVLELARARSEYVTRRENIIAVGNSGTRGPS
jgi:DNA replication protein DnaC